MDIRVLGPVELVDDGAAIPLGGQKQRTVLAVLVAAAGGRVATEQLIDAVYGDVAPERARRSIHTFISSLRRVLGDLIESDRRGYTLDVPDAIVDSRRFESAYHTGLGLIDTDPDAAAEVLREGLSEWRGHAYSDVDAREMVGLEITRLAELRSAAVEARIEADLARGLHRELVSELGALVTEHPLRERLRAQHMLALYRSGRQAEAIRSYSSARTMLIEQLGVEPSEELQDLELRILEQDPELTIDLRPTIEAMSIVACEASVPAQTMHEREGELSRLHDLFQRVAADRGGRLLDVRGTTMFAAFPSVERAASAAEGLIEGGGRIAVDRGDVDVSDDIVTGPPVTRAARLAAVAHPGQVLLSADAHAALSAGPDEGWILKSLGHHQLAGTPEPAPVFQLVPLSGPSEFGALELDRRPAAAPGSDTAPLSGYELRTVLGTDDLGTVYGAYQPSLGREVWLRMLSSEVADDARFIRRFEAEMHRIASIHHPAVLPILDFWRDPHSAVVIYQPVDRSVAFDPTRQEHGGLDTIMTIAEALAHTHERGVVHGHVQHGSILIDDRGHPIVADLGLAPILSGLTPMEALAPTAPEVIGAMPTAASDVYALGALAAEALAREPWDPDGGPPRIEGAIGDLIRACLDPDPNRRPPTGGDFLAALGDAMSRPMVHRRPVRNPYKGLAAFGEADAGDYFGRERLVDRLVREIGRHRLTAIVGPSGVGKSSAMRAGVLPRLRKGAAPGLSWVVITDMTPGADPFESLADALGRVAITVPGPLVRALADESVRLGEVVASVLPPDTELVLVIDQFEELFTLATPADLQGFLAMLERELTTGDGPVRVVVTLRADFLDRPLAHPTFGELIAARTVAVHGPSRRELVDIVARPVAAVGVEVEPALVDAMCDDASTQPGALPLVEHALTELFDGRTSDTLTLEAYQLAGRLAGAVGRSAEAVFQGLEETDRETARAVMVALVAVGEESTDTRRRVRLPQLIGSGLDREAVDRVLEAFVARRLVVLDRDPRTRQPTAEVAHEALISEWDRLRAWLEEAREDLLVARRVEAAARDWLASERDPSFLMSGARLDQAEALGSGWAGTVGDEETEFLTESRRVADAAAARRRRNRRRLTTVLATALAITVALAAVANGARNSAARRAVENRVQELAAQAEVAVGKNHDLAILLALESYEHSQRLGDEVPGDVMLALHRSTQSSRIVTRIPHGESVVLYHPTEDLLYVDVAGSSELVVYETESYEEVGRFDVLDPPFDAAFSPDGTLLAVTYESVPGVRLFDTTTGELQVELPGPGGLAFPQFSPDGRYLTGPTFTAAYVWDLNTPESGAVALDEATGWPASLGAFGADGTTIIRASGDPEAPTAITTYDLATGEAIGTHQIPVRSIRAVVSAPGSDTLLIATPTAGELWEPGAATPIREIPLTGPDHGTFSYSGDLLALHGNNESVIVESVDGSTRLVLEGHLGNVPNTSFSRDSSTLAALESSGSVTVWDLSPSGPQVLANMQTVGLDRLIPLMAPDGSTVATIEATGDVSVARSYDTATGRLIAQSSPSVSVVAVSRSGEWAGGVDAEGYAWIERLDNGKVIFEAPCLTPVAINDEGTHAAFHPRCRGGEEVTQLIDLRSRDVVTTWGGFGNPEFGPPDSPAEGIVTAESGLGPVFWDVMTGYEVATAVLGPVKWRPRFSADGRYVSVGSGHDGGFVMSVEGLLAGAPPEEYVIINPRIEGGPTRNSMASGDLAVTTHNEDSIRVWRLDTGEEWMNIPTRATTFAFVAMSPDGKVLYYPDHDGVLVRALLDPEELVALARSRVTRDFTVQECERFAIADDCSLYDDAGSSS